MSLKICLVKVLLVILNMNLLSKTNAQSCTLPSGGSSECIRIHLCPYVYDQVKKQRPPLSPETTAFLNKYACTPNRFATVCCPVSSGVLQPLKPAVTQPPITQPNTISPPSGGNVGNLGVVHLPREEIQGNNLPARTILSKLSNHRNFRMINSRSCGISNTVRIVGGKSASLGEFPWMVLLKYSDPFSDNPFKCAGTLITKFTVLSAAHCISKREQITSVRLGEHVISTAQDCELIDENEEVCAPPVQNIDVESIVPHPNYNTPKFANDIALIRLKTAADLSQDNVKTICLPYNLRMVQYSSQDPMIITGWGKTSHQGRSSDVLLKADIPFLNLNECRNIFSSNVRTQSINILDSHLCAKGLNNTDTCQGDSGGPIQAFGVIYKQSRLIQSGIVSTGVVCSQGTTYPGLYTDVSYYMRFILDNLK